MPVKKRTLLESLSKAALVEFARGWDVPGFSTMSKPELVDALAGMRSLPLADVLEQLSRDELKAACEAEGLDTSGREKSVLIERLLGRADDDAKGGANGGARERFALKADAEPDPKLGFGAKSRASAAVGSSAPGGRGEKAPGKGLAKGTGKRAIEQYEHTAERLNNPPVGLVTPESDPVTPAPGTKARKQYQYDPNLDPTLQWAGKAERLSFEVETVSLHVHERIDPKTILEAVKAKNGKPHEEQMGLFAKPRENPPLREAIDFYKHPHGWSNRLIAGDSLLVMNSLLEKEGMAGKVQMVYFDPPYGIKYGSNFQPFVKRSTIKDRADDHLTREPEMLKAFRDTWELGIHSFLAYIRDRLLLARELMAESGSVFVQISDENVHRVRAVMDEVFGADNCVAQIAFTTTTSEKTKTIAGICDYLVWYCKNRDQLKFRPLFTEKMLGGEGGSKYRSVRLPDGTIRGIGTFEDDALPEGARVFRLDTLTSQRPGGRYDVRFEGKTYRPEPGYWKPSEEGMPQLLAADRVRLEGKRLAYVRYFDDFKMFRITNVWNDLSGIQSRRDAKVYAVQTPTMVIERAMLMTTDPGDLALDFTCGSGTTAVVAETYGRRWITCDTSRIAVTLAKQRLMQQDFDYYTLKHPEQGVAGGFDYKTVPHVTLRSIANNPEIKVGMSRVAIDRAIAKYAEQEPLYDKPEPDPSRVRVTGPFTVEAVPAPVVKPVADLEADADAVARERGEADSSIARDGETLRQAQWRSELLKTGARGEGGMMLGFTRVEPLAGARYLHALAETRDKGGFRKATWKSGDSVAICFGPEHAPLEQRTVELAWEEARELTPRPAVLLFAAFAFDPEAQRDIDEMDAGKAGMLFLRAGMNDDLATEDLKKKRSSNESFWLIGQPEIALRRIASGADAGKYAVEVQGFDYFDPKKSTIESGGTDRIAMWMLDTDYDGRSVFPRQVFFPMAGAKDGWARLGASLRAEIDQEKIEAYRGVKSLPFEVGKFGRVAVKIVDDRGIESLVVRGLDEAEGAPPTPSNRGAKK